MLIMEPVIGDLSLSLFVGESLMLLVFLLWWGTGWSTFSSTVFCWIGWIFSFIRLFESWGLLVGDCLGLVFFAFIFLGRIFSFELSVLLGDVLNSLDLTYIEKSSLLVGFTELDSSGDGVIKFYIISLFLSKLSNSMLLLPVPKETLSNCNFY